MWTELNNPWDGNRTHDREADAGMQYCKKWTGEKKNLEMAHYKQYPIQDVCFTYLFVTFHGKLRPKL